MAASPPRAAGVLHDRAVARALPCGPIFVPNHKLIPDERWILHRTQDGVLARSSARVGPPRGGVAILVHRRYAMLKQAQVSDPVDNLPPPGFDRVAATRYYAAYVRC
ncbi:MAG: hypothetical protein M3296_10065 [Actinomycetota bacterium]|nr:hypothetical protein [Actinomycetota bacterium]